MAARAPTPSRQPARTPTADSWNPGPTNARNSGNGPRLAKSSLNRKSGLAPEQPPAESWGNGAPHDDQHYDSRPPSQYGGNDHYNDGYDHYAGGYDNNMDHHDDYYGNAPYQQSYNQGAPQPITVQRKQAPKAKGGGFLCCFKPKEEPEDKYRQEDEPAQTGPKKIDSVDEPASALKDFPLVLADGPAKVSGSQRSHASSKALPALPTESGSKKDAKVVPQRPSSRAGTEVSVKSHASAASKHSLIGSRMGVDPSASPAPAPPASSADAAEAVANFLKAVTPAAQRDPSIRAAVADITKLQQAMRAVKPDLDDLPEANALAGLLDLACAELASGEPVTKAKDIATEAELALAAAFDWLGSNGPVRVIRSMDARLMWATAFGSAVEAPFDDFSAKLAAYIVQSFPGIDPKQVGDRLDKTELAQSRLRWHVDKDNKGSVTVMDVDRAFPPHISLVERVGTFIDTQPDTAAAFAAASVNIPSRPAPGRLLGRETDVTMVLDRVTKAGEDIVVLAPPGMGASAIISEVANRALLKREFPGGIYYTDLAGVESREAAAVALALTVNAPRAVAEKDVDAAVVAALRHIGEDKLTLIVFDSAESFVESSPGGGHDLTGFVSKLHSVGPNVRFLIATSHPFPFDGFGVVRIGPLPSRDLIKAYQDASPSGWEWRVSHNAAKEMASLTARVPLAYRIVSAAIKNKVKNSADVLLALREARGVKIEGDLDQQCSCDMQMPWEALEEIWSDKREGREAEAMRRKADFEESDFAFDHGEGKVAGLKYAAYERLVAGCVKLALGGASEEARALLVACGLLRAPFGAAQAGVLADQTPLEARASLEELVSLGLAERDERRGLYSVHALVRGALLQQAGERDALVPVAKQRLMSLASRVTTSAGEDLDRGRAQLGKYALDCQRSLLDQVSSHWFTSGADPETVSRAEWVAGRLEELRAERVAPDDAPVDTADTTGELAKAREQAEDHMRNERFERARDQFREILEAQVEREGGYALSTAATRARIGDACCELGEFDAATEEYNRALVTQVVAKGTREHPDVAALHVAVGNCKLRAGDAQGAETEYRLALDVTARVFGAEALECAAPLNALGNAYREQLRFDDALERYRLALQIRREKLGETSVATQDTLANIAAVYAEQGRFKEAADMLLKAGLVFTRELGAQHPETVKVQVLASRMLDEHKRQQADAGGNVKEHEMQL